MEILLNSSQASELFGEVIFIGATPKYRYDRENKRRTDDIEGTVVELASEKLGKTLNVISEDTAIELAPFTKIQLINLKYSPYAKSVSANFAELVERFFCQKISAVKG